MMNIRFSISIIILAISIAACGKPPVKKLKAKGEIINITLPISLTSAFTDNLIPKVPQHVLVSEPYLYVAVSYDFSGLILKYLLKELPKKGYEPVPLLTILSPGASEEIKSIRKTSKGISILQYINLKRTSIINGLGKIRDIALSGDKLYILSESTTTLPLSLITLNTEGSISSIEKIAINESQILLEGLTIISDKPYVIAKKIKNDEIDFAFYTIDGKQVALISPTLFRQQGYSLTIIEAIKSWGSDIYVWVSYYNNNLVEKKTLYKLHYPDVKSRFPLFSIDKKDQVSDLGFETANKLRMSPRWRNYMVTYSLLGITKNNHIFVYMPERTPPRYRIREYDSKGRLITRFLTPPFPPGTTIVPVLSMEGKVAIVYPSRDPETDFPVVAITFM